MSHAVTAVSVAADRVRALLAETMPCPVEVVDRDHGVGVSWRCGHEQCHRMIRRALDIGDGGVPACYEHWAAGGWDAAGCVDDRRAVAGQVGGSGG